MILGLVHLRVLVFLFLFSLDLFTFLLFYPLFYFLSTGGNYSFGSWPAMACSGMKKRADAACCLAIESTHI